MGKEVAEKLCDIGEVLRGYNISSEDADRIMDDFERIAEIVKGLENTLYDRG